jgi:hypothetical protein
LPVELCERVAQCLTVERVSMDHAVAVSCSSHAKSTQQDAPPLSLSDCCLSEDETTWWISEEGLNVRPQFVHIGLVGPGQSACRLQAVSIKIPPLPQGPMSVREFALQSYIGKATGFSVTETQEEALANFQAHRWQDLSRTPFTVANQTGFQRFELDEPADVSSVRVLCLSNQMQRCIVSTDWVEPQSSLYRQRRQQRQGQQQHQVGFYSVKFD